MKKNKLSQICLDHGTNLKELGDKLGKSRQYMSELARGNIKLSYEMATKIASAFGTTPDTIFLDTGSNGNGQSGLRINTGTEG